MDVQSQRPEGRDGVPSTLDVAIEVLNLAKEICSITPAKAVFGTVSALLTMIRVRSLSFYGDGFQTQVHSGLDGQ
jgi:hypothetical protein